MYVTEVYSPRRSTWKIPPVLITGTVSHAFLVVKESGRLASPRTLLSPTVSGEGVQN